MRHHNLMTIALLATGSAFTLALSVALPKLSKGLIPIGAALGGGAIAMVLVGERDGDRATYPTATSYPPSSFPDRQVTPPSPSSPPLSPRPWQSPPNPPIELMAGTIICVGAQGSGKSSTAARLLHQRVANGARGIVLNHHASYGHYAGLEIYGRGESYQDRFLSLETGMRMIIGELDRRYHKLQTEPDPIFEPIAILMDEMSSWKGGVSKELVQQFVKLCLTDTRKAAITTIWACHNLTSECWGGVEGVASLVKSSGTILWLLPSPDGTGDMVASEYGELENQGKKRRVKLFNILPNISGNIYDFTQYQVPAKLPDIQSLERAYSLESPIPSDWQAILDYLQSRDLETAKVRELQQARIPRGGIKADEIREILAAMATANLIEFDGNEAALSR